MIGKKSVFKILHWGSDSGRNGKWVVQSPHQDPGAQSTAFVLHVESHATEMYYFHWETFGTRRILHRLSVNLLQDSANLLSVPKWNINHLVTEEVVLISLRR